MAKKDRVYLGPPDDHGHHPYVRDQEGEVSVGVLGTHGVEGAQGHLELKHVEGSAFDVVSDIAYTCNTPRSGPPKVNTDKYRQNWGNIFGKKQTVGQA